MPEPVVLARSRLFPLGGKDVSGLAELGEVDERVLPSQHRRCGTLGSCGPLGVDLARADCMASRSLRGRFRTDWLPNTLTRVRATVVPQGYSHLL